MKIEDLNNTNKKVISEWFGKKYRVTPETSKLLQEEVFKAGGKWRGETEFVQLTEAPFLFVSDSGEMSYSYDYWFDIIDKPEGVLELKLTLKDVIEPAPETVEINGKHYLKSDIERLTPVK